MEISLIVAMQTDRGIGFQGRIPWRLSADLQNFKRVTMGHHLVVGRITWESLGRPLPGRRMVVVTRQAGYDTPDGVDVVGSLDEALLLVRDRGETELFIGGGRRLYAESLPAADRVYLTRVQAAVEADTFFPDYAFSNWQVSEEWAHAADERNEYAFTFQKLERKPMAPTPFTEAITFLYTRDLEATAAFCEQTLGLTLAVDQGDCRIYRVSKESFLGYCSRPGDAVAAGGAVFTFVTEDVDSWAEKLESQGVPVEKKPAPNDTYGIYNCFFRDPNGYLMEIQRFLDPDWANPA